MGLALGFLVMCGAYYIRRPIIRYGARLVTEKRTDAVDSVVAALSGPIGMLIFVVGVYMGVVLIGFKKQDFPFIGAVYSTMIFIILLWAGYNLTTPLADISQRSLTKLDFSISKDLVQFMARIARVVIFIFGFIGLLGSWGVDVSVLVGGIGIITAALAFASQDTLKHLFGSVAIMLDDAFSRGDWIRTPSVEGEIEEIGFRTTTIRQFDKGLVVVPNAKLADQEITNFSRRPTREVRMKLTVPYSISSKKMHLLENRIKEILKEHEEVDKKVIPPFVYFDSFGDSALLIYCRFYTTTSVYREYMRIKEEVLYKIKDVFEKDKVPFAYPTQTIQIQKEDD